MWYWGCLSFLSFEVTPKVSTFKLESLKSFWSFWRSDPIFCKHQLEQIRTHQLCHSEAIHVVIARAEKGWKKHFSTLPDRAPSRWGQHLERAYGAKVLGAKLLGRIVEALWAWSKATVDSSQGFCVLKLNIWKNWVTKESLRSCQFGHSGLLCPLLFYSCPVWSSRLGFLGAIHYVFPKCCIFISLPIPYLSPKNNAEFGIDDDPMVQLQDSKRHWWLQPLRNRSGQLCSCQHLHLGRTFCWWVVVLVFARLQHIRVEQTSEGLLKIKIHT